MQNQESQDKKTEDQDQSGESAERSNSDSHQSEKVTDEMKKKIIKKVNNGGKSESQEVNNKPEEG